MTKKSGDLPGSSSSPNREVGDHDTAYFASARLMRSRGLPNSLAIAEAMEHTANTTPALKTMKLTILFAFTTSRVEDVLI
eukprot:83340-Prymnesium_polylepis.1